MTDETPILQKAPTPSGHPAEVLGRLFSRLLRPQNNHRLFLLVSWDDFGDGITNALNLATAFQRLNPVIIICQKGNTNIGARKKDLKDFKLIDLHKMLNRSSAGTLKSFHTGVIAKWINRSDRPIVTGMDTSFFYELLPLLKGETKKIDWLHHDDLLAESLQSAAQIDARIVNSKYLENQLQDRYEAHHVPAPLKERIHFISDAISIAEDEAINRHDELQALFIKRNEPADRIKHLAESAQMIFKKRLPIHISFVGVSTEDLDFTQYPFCTFHKNLDDKDLLEEVKLEADVLLLPGKFVEINHDIMEMMALGKPIITIAEGPIHDLIKDEVSGYQIKDYEKDKNIIDDFHIALSILAADRPTLLKLGRQCRKDAVEKFNLELFQKKWEQIIGVSQH